MKETRLLKNNWTSVLLNEQTIIIEVENPDSQLFFGTPPAPGMKIANTFPQDVLGRTQGTRITDAITCATSEQRNVFLEYTSRNQGEEIAVVMHVEYLAPGQVCLHAMAVNAGDMARTKTEDNEDPAQKALHKTIYENMPIGLEIYDSNGILIEMNTQEMIAMGIKDKKDVLGISMFNNPNISDQFKEQLRRGENVHFTSDYDFSLAQTYYKTQAKESRHFAFTVSVIHNTQGAIDKYLVISQDITEQVKYQHKYETLYNETQTIIDSLPVGVGLYAPNGTLIECNATLGRMFNIKSHEDYGTIHISQNPLFPVEVKEALRSGKPLHMRFPYTFDAVVDPQGHIVNRKRTIQIECNGHPIVGNNTNQGNYVFIIEDVTKEVETQEILRHSKKKTELAMHDADIMIWELDIKKRSFFCDNEPMNGFSSEKPIATKEYIESAHPEDQPLVTDIIHRMLKGEDWAFRFEARIQIPGYPGWQYCTISGSPYERDAAGKVTKFVGSRKNNTELEKKKLLLNNILNSIPLSIHIKDIEDNFHYIFCNDESTKMFGSSIDKTIYDIMGEEQVALIEKTDKEVFTTGDPYLGLEHISLTDGRSYDTIVRKSIIYDGDKRLLLNVRWDQTLQNDLERRAKLLTLTMETMKAYTWFYEPGSTQLSFGDGFDKISRKASDVNSLEKFLACVHPEDTQKFVDSLTTVAAQDTGIWQVECRMSLDDDGVYRWWEARGMLETTMLNGMPHKYMFGMTINIDNHKQAEITLLQNKEELKHLIRQNELVLNNTNSGLAFITPDYIVQWENISICSASLSFEAYKKGEPCYQSAHNRSTPCENCVMQRAFKSHQTEQIKFSLHNNHTVEIFGTPVVAQDGTVEGIVIRVDDITEREQMIQELRQAKAHAEQSDKLKSAFLANMSHEIRTPLNAIVGFSELLMTAPEEEEREEYLRIISNNNELLLKLINDILDLSKIEAGSVELKYEEFDLAEYFDGMSASMKQRVTNPNVRLVAENPHEICRVRLDKNRVAQILTNYVTNAIKYTPKGFIEMGYECVLEGIRFYVKDSGIGIAEEKKNKVFHRFEKLDEFAQGTGLGLSICKAIAESMGGSVGFDSHAGEGSLFWAILPCDPDTTSENSPATTALSMGVGSEADATPDTVTETTEGRKTILVAEDIASNYLLVSALLRKDYNLLHAQNGEEAVEMVQQQHVDLVLMDMKMPEMDGLKATAMIREFNTTLPIIALTAHAFDADRQAAIMVGCNDYLVKPVNKIKLLEALKEYCGSPKK